MVIESYRCYRARVSNGVIVESTNFKYVYDAAIRELRDTYGHNVFFTCGDAELTDGVITEVTDGSAYKQSWIELRKIARIDCFSIDRKTYIATRREK